MIPLPPEVYGFFFGRLGIGFIPNLGRDWEIPESQVLGLLVALFKQKDRVKISKGLQIAKGLQRCRI